MTLPERLQASGKPAHAALFDEWLQSRTASGEKARERLSAQAAEPYRFVWESWCRWLTAADGPGAHSGQPRRASFLLATTADVDAFLAKGIQASRKPAAGAAARQVSDITLLRYGSLLQRIYEFAVNNGLMDENPARARKAGSVATLKRQGRRVDPAGEGLVLNELQWKALYKALPAATSSDAMDLRDRAIILLLMDAHLTSSEMCDLDVGNLSYQIEGGAWVEVTQGARKSQERQLQLQPRTWAALEGWLAARKKLPIPKPSTSPKKASGVDAESGNALFVTDRNWRRLSKRVLFTVVSRTLADAGRMAGFEVPYHSGPQVLRNTKIVFRLRKGDPEELVAAEAGYKDKRSFRGLQRHLDR